MPRKLPSAIELDFFLNFRELLERRRESEEKQSEQRVAFLLALLTFVFAAIGLFAKEGYCTNILTLATFISMSILLLFGVLTFARIVWRQRNIDDLDRKIKKISIAIEALDDNIAKSVHVEDPPDIVVSKFKNVNWLANHLNGSLAQFLYVIECLLAFGCIYLITRSLCYDFISRVGIAATASAAMFVFLFRWSQTVRNRDKKTNGSLRTA